MDATLAQILSHLYQKIAEAEGLKASLAQAQTLITSLTARVAALEAENDQLKAVAANAPFGKGG